MFDLGHSAARRYILNFPTKRHWRDVSCGLGGLDWALVRLRIEQAFVNMGQVDIVVFEPHEVADLKERKAEEA